MYSIRSLFSAGIIVILIVINGCSNYEPVDVSQCGSVVKHAKKVLGDLAPSSSEMMADCKNASDKERGCAMAATKKGQLAQCM